MTPYLRFLLAVALLCLPAVEASAHHLHYVPIQDSRYAPNTLDDLFGEDDLERWIIASGSDTFSFIGDVDNIYSVSDGSGGAMVAFDHAFFEDVDPRAVAFIKFYVNSLPGSGDPLVSQTIEVGFTDLATTVKWDEAQGTISGTKGGVGSFTVENIPPWNQGQLLPWEVTLYYDFHDFIFTGVVNGVAWNWKAGGGTVNPFSYFYPFAGTDANYLDIYAYAKCEDQCELQVLDWGRLSCGTTEGGDLDVGSCVGLRVVGNGIIDPGENCDDGNTLPGDGCDQNGHLEQAGRECQLAIGKAGKLYAESRLTRLQKCVNLMDKGKTLYQDEDKTIAIVYRSECPSEFKTAKKIASTREKVRKLVANKCTDTLVNALHACGDTIDELVSADGTSGCLIETHDAAVADLITAQYGG